MVANAVFDPLAAYDADGTVQPYLAESFTPNEDYTSWTITMRPGVTFHDGTPLDGAAVKKDLDAAAASPLVGAAVSNIESVEVDPSNPLAVIVDTVDPWASLPASLTAQVGMIAAPTQLDSGAEGSSRRPIGTGPFVLESWEPDKAWVGTRNESYWRTDADGNALPYLDEVEFRPIVDHTNRTNALISGDVQLLHTTDWASINRIRSEAEAGSLQFVTEETEAEENFILMNTSKAPCDDVRVREAVALCTAPNQVQTVWEAPLERVADSQFTPDSPWYDPESGYPDMDVQAGTDLISEVEAENGPVRFTLGTTPVPTNVAATEVLAQQYSQCGMDVELKTTAQSTFITDTVTGNYEANLWRQFAATDPDGDYQWWIGANAEGPLTLNMARLADSQIDAALNEARASADPAVRKQAYSDLQRRQSELFPYAWIAHTQWGYGAATNVRNIGNVTLPDGSAAQQFQAGSFRLTETWLDEQ
jgi:peptide/nickel transport system substrate-binding protein